MATRHVSQIDHCRPTTRNRPRPRRSDAASCASPGGNKEHGDRCSRPAVICRATRAACCRPWAPCRTSPLPRRPCGVGKNKRVGSVVGANWETRAVERGEQSIQTKGAKRSIKTLEEATHEEGSESSAHGTRSREAPAAAEGATNECWGQQVSERGGVSQGVDVSVVCRLYFQKSRHPV